MSENFVADMAELPRIIDKLIMDMIPKCASSSEPTIIRLHIAKSIHDITENMMNSSRGTHVIDTLKRGIHSNDYGSHIVFEGEYVRLRYRITRSRAYIDNDKILMALVRRKMQPEVAQQIVTEGSLHSEPARSFITELV